MERQPKIGVLCNSTMGIPSLQLLLSNKLVTAIGVPDKVHDATNDVKNIADSFGTKTDVFSKKDLSNTLAAWVSNNKLDMVLVFTFPWKISTDVLSLPGYGFINFHFGLLPQYRGADAIFWSIRNKEPYGGISIHYMDEGFDTGALIHVEKIPILPTDTYGMHSAKLANANIMVLQKLMPLLLSGNTKGNKQTDVEANYYSKPQLKNIAIDWEKQSADEIVALVNACNPWNKGAYTMYNGMPLRITEASVINTGANNVSHGEIIEINDSGIQVQCHNGVLNAKVITIEEGIYTASSFAKYCGLKTGLKFNKI